MSDPPHNAEPTEDVDFEDAFNNAPCGYALLSPNGQIKRVNTALAAWIGASPDALVGQHIRDLLSVAGRIVFETSFAPLLRLQGGFEEIALDLLHAEGARVPVLASATDRRRPSGEIVEVRLVVVRASERRVYERDLQSREAIAVRRLVDEQASSLLREQFIAVLGHDLRNPLAAVTSGIRLLQRDPSKERAEMVAGMMNASVLRMSGMIDNVLDFARGRLGGGISLQRGPVDLKTILTQVVDELRNANPGRVIRESYALPPFVNCDPARIAQMMSNLVGNACTHGDPATIVDVAAFTSGDSLEIAVANGGTSIPEKKLLSLFEPFSYEPGSAPKQGLGLGLFIAAEIAKSHVGELTATSSDDETRLTFRMPLASA